MTTYGEIGTLTAGVVAGVGLTADTEITVSTITMPRSGTIKVISWGYGNVVDAKAATGYLELKSNIQQGPFRFPVGLGVGGAATTNNGKRGRLDVSIPVEKSEIITITMTMNEDCVAAHAGILWSDSEGGELTYMDCNTVEDAAITAATLESPGSITIPAGKGGRIKKIFVAIADVTNGKTVAGYVELITQNTPGPFRFPVGGGMGGATNSTPLMNAEEIDVDIPIGENEIVTFWYYFTDAKVNGLVGILWVSS